MDLLDTPSSVAEISLPDQKPWRHKRQEAAQPRPMSPFQLRIHRCLCLLVFSMIFEGITRKLAPSWLGNVIFFFKDLVAVILLLILVTGNPNVTAKRWLRIMGILFVLLGPCILLTAIKDPLLAIFGTKQYMLFPIAAVAMCAAYLPHHLRQFFSLFKWIALSVIMTTLVAVAQNQLPASNWLNLSVGGDDLSRFAAGGYLRVSSTFPFVGQYCDYLNALCYCLPVYFIFNKAFSGRAASLQTVVLIGLAIAGTFVTGSRTSVIGNAGILCAAGLLLVVCGGLRAISKVIIPVVCGIVLLGLIESKYPEFFAAYQARVSGTGEVSHTIEMKKRILSGLLDWTDGTVEAPPSLLGYGLGVMSNGSDKLSNYAAEWRRNGYWTETDQATTFFEGGWYLVLVWYGFRFWVIISSVALVTKLRCLEFQIAACFAWGYILVIGVTGVLAIQPAIAIWWWLAVGLITCLSHFDRELRKNKQASDFVLR